MKASSSKIAVAKNKAVGGKKDRCKKGKSCSATCISSWKDCLVEMSATVSGAVGRFHSKVRKAIPGAERNEYLKTRKEVYERVRGRLDQRVKEAAINGDNDRYSKLRQKALDLHKKAGKRLGIKWNDPENVWLPIAKDRYFNRKAEVVDKMIKAAKDGDKDRYAKLESSLLRMQSGSAVKFQDGSVIAKGNLWDRHSPAFDISNPERYDRAMKLEPLKREGDKGYDGWSNSQVTTAIGRGVYGQVNVDGENGNYVKRGVISDKEASLIKLLGDNDLGPKLVAADLDGAVKPGSKGYENLRDEGVKVVNGRIAMTPVPGKSFDDNTLPTKKVNGQNVADIYWKAMADLHRLGVAHNDTHPGNILIDDKGKGRWVDLGLGQMGVKAALSEALGSFFMKEDGDSMLPGNPAKHLVSKGAGFNIGEGNWQSLRWMMTGLYDYMDATGRGGRTMDKFLNDYPVLGRITQNVGRVRKRLKDMGFDDDESAALQMFGIRAPLENYSKGVWGKMTDSQAKELIELLYDGI
jgi:hypothetical protein